MAQGEGALGALEGEADLGEASVTSSESLEEAVFFSVLTGSWNAS